MDPAFADATGLSPDTIVVVGCGDEMAATLGAGVHTEGEVCDVAGTAEPVCAACGQPSEDPTMLVECHRHADPGAWLLENPGFVSGGSLRWWRDQFGIPEKQAEACGTGDAYNLLTQAAARIPPGSEGLIFLPYRREPWLRNGTARRGGCSTACPSRTRGPTCSGRCWKDAPSRSATSWKRCAALASGSRRITIVGGGAKGPLWRQIKADVTGLPVRVPTNVETTAAGAAILATVGSGECPGIGQAVQSFVTFEPDEHQPDPECRDAYEDAYPAVPRRLLRPQAGLRPQPGTHGSCARSRRPVADAPYWRRAHLAWAMAGTTNANPLGTIYAERLPLPVTAVPGSLPEARPRLAAPRYPLGAIMV